MRDCDNSRLITAVTDGFTTHHDFNPAAVVTTAAAGQPCAFSVHGYPESERSSYMSTSPSPHVRGHRVRELVCSYRALRDAAGHAVHVPTLALSDPRTAAMALGPLLAQEPVEVFAVACLSTRHRRLTWHIVSRGTRASTPVSMPDVFVPACLTPGTSAIVVVHNHPGGDPTPSPDDARLTLRLCAAADILDLPLIDHLIVGEAGRYYSFREAGVLGMPATRGDCR